MQKLMDLDSPLGRLILIDKAGALATVAFAGGRLPSGPYQKQETPLLLEAARQLAEYFSGKRRNFDLPLAPEGTEFQQDCWQALCAIPYGKTCSYGEIAAQIGRPKAVRAVGQANNRNPIAVIIPCHRVIGANGKLTGYGGGLDNKELLLELEQQNY